ncbi:riboflavin synthase, alpha subunit [Clostridium sp. DL-VIII]|uniref:riboflavin synthase n=1 Tax=Clostridium sp. DL-VIII TaxID=641107 RepID=UPI00023AFF79|nr:riboflavin synthase [Clostridium sp. DL-VIII]EHI98516.1 riboflavin synthase, alpha subunit [Clostridium sp. DL-VIII]
MFTGIIEEVGILQEFNLSSGFGLIEIKCKNVLEETRIGDSIATNGVCLTVKEMSSNSFKAEAMGETLSKSNLGNLKVGDKLNLERALRLSDRLGGHIVSGHIDGIGRIVAINEEKDGTWFTISAPKDVLKYIIYKGSIGIDGISLTVAYVDDQVFKVSIIPHTLDNTILPEKKVNSIVNLECDLVGKYIEKLFGGKNADKEEKKGDVTMEFLKNSGF